MKLLVITAGFYDRDYLDKFYRLAWTCRKFKIDIKVYGKGEFFNFFNSKIVDLGRVINNHRNDYTHVLYTDFADSFFLSGTKEIIEKYKNMNAKLVTAGQKGIYPFAQLDYLFPADGPYRFMNPGNFIGEIPEVLDALSACKAWPDIPFDDQAHWMLAVEHGKLKVKVDANAEIFQTFSDVEFDDELEIKGKRLVNKFTGTKPCIVHFNGPKGEGTVNEKYMERVFKVVTGGKI